MTKNKIYGQILYRGLVCEKGRVHSQLWKYSYRKILRLQVNLWQKILRRMLDNTGADEDTELLRFFVKLCKDNKEIGGYYIGQVDSVSSGVAKTTYEGDYVNSKEDMIIINFMNDLVLELCEALKPKIFINKKKIYLIIRALHNLPRYFLENTDNQNNGEIDFKSAIQYAFLNMNEDMKNRYVRYNFIN